MTEPMTNDEIQDEINRIQGILDAKISRKELEKELSAVKLKVAELEFGPVQPRNVPDDAISFENHAQKQVDDLVASGASADEIVNGYEESIMQGMTMQEGDPKAWGKLNGFF